MSGVLSIAGLVLGIHVAGFAGPAQTPDHIRRILTDRVEALTGGERGIGIVVGVVGPQGKRVVAYGQRARDDARAVDGTTVFEIGSVGKVFTALLLADMVQRGEVALGDPVGTFLPGVAIPSRHGRSIALVDLATHTSGLPFMVDQPDIRGFLATYEVPYDIGTRWEYSNIGYWLLGEALASRAKTDFASLLRQRVIVPLKLADTGFVLSARMKDNLAVGHDASLQPAPALSTVPVYSLMPAAGAGLYSTVNDLLTLLAAAMRPQASPLGPALAATVATRRPATEGQDQALGWTVIGNGNDQMIFRDGGTLGYASCLAWDPVKRVGVVVLSNQVASVSDIARHLLRPDFPLEHPRSARRTEISLDANALDAYVGRYDASGEGIFRIVREGDYLTIESPAEWGLPTLRIRPESRSEFFASELPLRVTFQAADDGRVTGMLVYPPRGQKAVPARRIP